MGLCMVRIGEMLIKEGLINHLQLKVALAVQAKGYPKKIGEILIDLRYIDENDLDAILIKQMHEAGLIEKL